MDNTLKLTPYKRSIIEISKFYGMNSNEDSSIKNVSYPEFMANFNTDSGVLTDAEGFEVFKQNDISFNFYLSKKPLGIYYYKYYDSVLDRRLDRIIAYMQDGTMQIAPLYSGDFASVGNFVQIENLHFSVAPTVIYYNYDNKDCLILSTEENGLFILKDRTITAVPSAPSFTSICIHNERLFATSGGESNTLWFSDDMNPENWSVSLKEAGYIELLDDKGKILKCVSFSGYLYVFKEYGISRLSAYGDMANFNLVNLNINDGKISASSITICDDCIIYYTNNGYFRFNGVSSYKILDCYDKYYLKKSTKSKIGTYSSGFYYSICEFKFENELGSQSVLLIYDLRKNTSRLILGVNPTYLCTLYGEFDCVLILNNEFSGIYKLNRKSGKLGENVLEKKWESGKTDFNIKDINKRLYKFTIYSDNVASIKISCDNKIKKYNLVAGYNIFMPNLKGNIFSLQIKSTTSNSRIYKPTFYLRYR